MRSSEIRIHNINLILGQLYKYRNIGLSQSALVTSTGLKAPTIFRIFNELEKRGSIKPIQKQVSKSEKITKGRRPLLYTIVPSSLYAISLEFYAGSLSLGIFNFSGIRISKIDLIMEADINIELIVDLIVSNINKLIDDNKIPRNKILGVAVAAPGQVDIVNKTVISYQRIEGLINYPLSKILEEKLKMNVILQNNSTALAYGEFLYGNIKHKNNLFAFVLSRGVNGALVNNGKIYRTISGTTLEVGNIPINFDGPESMYSSKGSLEEYLISIQESDSNPILSHLENNDDKILVEEVLEEASRYLIYAMESIITFFAPSTFVIETCSELISKELAIRIQRHFDEKKTSNSNSKIKVYGKKYNTLITQLGLFELLIQDYLI